MNGRETVYAVGFYPWKRRLLRTFRPAAKIKFLRSPEDLPRKAGLEVATWGTIFSDEEFPQGTRITRYEDGFIRSVGLGAKFTPALSWVADRRGIYYDATKPSELEDILEHADFSPETLQRAQTLREKVIRAGLTKYNLGGPAWRRPPQARRVILVPGQVESDASIRLGAGAIKTNIALLQTVRRENPEAYLVYKPHPDVVARVRREGAGESNAGAYCDSVITTAPMHQLIHEVDEVQVITSLAGFEALLRGKAVVAYGHPFYAGWGLTTDHHPLPRRTRRLSLDELVAGALLIYPLYCSAQDGQVCAAEQLIDELISGVRPRRRGALERLLGKLSDSRFWHRFCSS